MFSNSNILLFLMCIIPVVFYSILMFVNSPSFSIRFKTSFTYLYTGLLSVTLLQFLFFIFPHIQDTFFKIYIGSFVIPDGFFEVYQSTLASLLLFAFVQVALMEEFSKWLAFKCVNFIRGKRRMSLDHPYAMMFYSSLVAAAFAIVENIQYAQRAMRGDFGVATPENVLMIRAVSSVLIHMACGLFMGYYMALAKKATPIKKTLYNMMGIGTAAFMHGVYDFNWMKPGTQNDYYNITDNFPLHISSTIIIGFSILVAFCMSQNLKHMHDRELKQ